MSGSKALSMWKEVKERLVLKRAAPEASMTVALYGFLEDFM